jgi:putative two-component system response regulator
MTGTSRPADRHGSDRRMRALCVDDEAVTLKLIVRLLEDLGIAATPATSPLDGLRLFDQEHFDLVLTDIRMPGMSGLVFLQEIRARDPQVPILVATGFATLENAIRALREGASGMLVKPFTAEEFRTEIENALERARIRHDALQYRFVAPILDGVALALTAAIEARDIETGDHCRSLGYMGERVAAHLGLGAQERTTIRIGGFLHDVGKIAIADAILLKPGALTPAEYEEMKRHSELGAAIVETHVEMADIARIVRHHHERWDGHGYPYGLSGSAIPLGARIISVADAFSAMTTDRVYRAALPVEKAWDELRVNAGGQFDPGVVEAFEASVGLEGMAAGIVPEHPAPPAWPTPRNLAPRPVPAATAGRSIRARPSTEPVG